MNSVDPNSTNTYFSVALSMLETGSTLPCEIYLRRADATPVLYRGVDSAFGESHRQRLMESGIETILIRFVDAERWNRYLEQGLRTRINDPGRPTEERARLLIDVARPLLKEALAQPQAPEVKQRVTELANSVCDLLRQPAAMHATVQLMQHDYYTYTHSLHVAIYSVALARARRIDAEDLLASISAGALMHDCGKCKLPVHLINRAGRLSNAEWELMQAHPSEGARIVQAREWNDQIVGEMCLMHHERLDGSGYPRGVLAAQIPEAARIVAIADAYDAMTTDRSYQQALTGAAAMKILRRDHASRYDQNLVEQLIRLLLDPVAR
jgi:HD-GYP domain-containing protein (c-di-GMP phosphodiesterase class II)